MSTELVIALFGLIFSLLSGGTVMFLLWKVQDLKNAIKIERMKNNKRARNLSIKYHALVLMTENDEIEEEDALEYAKGYLKSLESLAKEDMGMLTPLEMEARD